MKLIACDHPFQFVKGINQLPLPSTGNELVFKTIYRKFFHLKESTSDYFVVTEAA